MTEMRCLPFVVPILLALSAVLWLSSLILGCKSEQSDLVMLHYMTTHSDQSCWRMNESMTSASLSCTVQQVLPACLYLVRLVPDFIFHGTIDPGSPPLKPKRSVRESKARGYRLTYKAVRSYLLCHLNHPYPFDSRRRRGKLYRSTDQDGLTLCNDAGWSSSPTEETQHSRSSWATKSASTHVESFGLLVALLAWLSLLANPKKHDYRRRLTIERCPALHLRVEDSKGLLCVPTGMDWGHGLKFGLNQIQGSYTSIILRFSVGVGIILLAPSVICMLVMLVIASWAVT